MEPNEPGFYYFRHARAPREHIWIAQVVHSVSGELRATVFADLEGRRISYNSVRSIKGDWFGPLPSPESFGA